MTEALPNVVRTVNLTPSDLEGKENRKDCVGVLGLSARRRVRGAEGDRLLAMAEFLPVRDALLVQEFVTGGRGVCHLARLMGVSRHRVRNRILKLIARTGDVTFRYVVSRRVIESVGKDPGAWRVSPRKSWPKEWSAGMRAAAELCVLQGMPERSAAAKSGFSYHEIRQHVRGLKVCAGEWAGAVSGER